MYNVQIRPLDHSDLTDQVTNALMNSCNNELMNFSYSYDAMGNRKQASELSASSGISALSVYSANNLNQYTFISNHVGSLQPTAYSLQPSYDLNGNMTWDGTNAYFWDLQNQLILVSNAEVQVSSAYDAMGRRIRKEVTVWDEQLTAYRSQFTSRFYYDGWNLVRETIQFNSLTPPNSLTNCYTWGNDLSGSLQGAGGVGGLLAVISQPTANSQQPTAYYPLYDHNGNVERYVSRNGATVVSFQYDAFGNTVASALMNSSTNELLNFSFPFRFSTKYWDAEAELFYYGYRYYSPRCGSWLGRDPIGEKCGGNLYCINMNDNENQWEYLGLQASIFRDPWINPFWPSHAFEGPNSGLDVGWDWLSGQLDDQMNYGGGDAVTQDVSRSPEVDAVRKSLRTMLQAGCQEGITLPISRSLSNESELMYMASFFHDLIMNRGRALLGSFSGNATVQECTDKCCAVVKFSIYTPLSWSSGTRLAPSLHGYKPGGSIVTQFWQIMATAGFSLYVNPASSIIPDNYFGKYGKNSDVHLEWTEVICPGN